MRTDRNILFLPFLFLYKIAPKSNAFRILKANLPKKQIQDLNKLLSARCKVAIIKAETVYLESLLQDKQYNRSMAKKFASTNKHFCLSNFEHFLKMEINDKMARKRRLVSSCNELKCVEN